MLNSTSARIFMFFSILFLVSTIALRAQDPTPEQKKFWDDFSKVHATGDVKELLRMVRRNKEMADDAYNYYVIFYANGGLGNTLFPVLEALADQLTSTLKNSVYSYKVDYLHGLSQEEMESWARAWADYVNGYAAFTEGLEQDNPYKMDEAVILFGRAIKILEEVGDLMTAADIQMRLAEASEDVFKDPYEACLYYKKSVDQYGQLPEKHKEKLLTPINEAAVTERLQAYLDKGYDPTKARDEGGEPSAEALAAAEKGTDVTGGGSSGEFKMPSFQLVTEEKDEWKFKYATMKKPDEFFTPSFFTGYNPFLWGQIWFDSKKAPSGQQFTPYFGNMYFYLGFYGKQMNIFAKDNKFYVDVAAEKKTRSQVKASTKPTKFTITGIDNGPDGKPYKYQLFLQLLGEQEVMFSLTQNNAVKDPGQIAMRLRTGCYTKGKMLGQNCTLIDDNCSGLWGDLYFKEADPISGQAYKHILVDAMVIGKEKIARPWSQYINIDGKWYFVTWGKEADGRKLYTAEVKVETGKVRLDWQGDTAPDYMVLHLIDSNNPSFFINVAQAVDEAMEIPIGEYEIAFGKIETKKKGQAKQVRIYHGTAEFIKILENKETVLEMGAPYKLTFDTETSGKEYRIKGSTLEVWGRMGELYTLFFDEVPTPIVSIRDKSSGKVVVKNEETRISSQEDFWSGEDRYCYWYHADFVYENKRGGELEAKLEAKKIKLLGGPAASEWR